MNDKAIPSSNQQLATELAKRLFKLGAHGPEFPCSRIQFMGGDWKTKEHGQGGMIESALASWLREQLDLIQPVETSGQQVSDADLEEIANAYDQGPGGTFEFDSSNILKMLREVFVLGCKTRWLSEEPTCTCGRKDGLHEFNCQRRREGDDGKGAVKASDIEHEFHNIDDVAEIRLLRTKLGAALADRDRLREVNQIAIDRAQAELESREKTRD